jgi:lantibiotic modifying enzyme
MRPLSPENDEYLFLPFQDSTAGENNQNDLSNMDIPYFYVYIRIFFHL